MVHAAAPSPVPEPLAGPATDALRQVLDPAEPSPEPDPGERAAAVLIPWIEGASPSLLFTVRAPNLTRHPGEISFPGGLRDPGESMLATALRETREELGLDPAAVRILGALPPVRVSVSGTFVVPFVAAVPDPPAPLVNAAEIAEVLVFPVAGLVAAERLAPAPEPFGSRTTWRGPTFPMGEHTIWGATGSMLHALLERIRGDTARAAG